MVTFPASLLRRFFWFSGCALLLSACGGAQDIPDSDRDGIADTQEGSADTDTDGVPDFQDEDSDNDGIPDAVEAGDEDPETPPPDSDGDGVPNFQDEDSDNNGFSDVDDSLGDADGDTILDAFEQDDDNDGMPDTQELEDGAPIDSDGDGVPNFQDSDSDNDDIPDRLETMRDSDGDGIPNLLDEDSDNDGVLDSLEGGLDVDDDGAPNFLDIDSDNDGLSDPQEQSLGTSPILEDTDGDGSSDLIEVTLHDLCLADPSTCNGDPDPLDANVGVSPDDFVFVLPFEDPPQTGALRFATEVTSADIHFSVDTTGSMGQEINNLKAGLGTIIQQVSDPVEGIPDTAFGVSSYEDFPLSPYGALTDAPFRLLQRITTDPGEAQSGVDALLLRNGGDLPESGYEALFQIATGAGVEGFVSPFSPGAGFSPDRNGLLGGVGFREGALPIVIQVTDAVSHRTESDALPCLLSSVAYGANGSPSILGAHGRGDATAALQSTGAQVIGIASNQNQIAGCSPRGDLEELAQATGAEVPPEAFTDADGNRPAGCSADECCTAVNGAGRPAEGGLCPLVFDVNANGSGAFTSLIVTAIRALTRFARLNISAQPRSQAQETASGDLIDPVEFIDALRAVSLQPAPSGGPQIDPVTQTFLDVQPGTSATFALTAENDFLPQEEVTQIFTLQINVLGDAVTVLDTRQVVIIVPARIDEVIL